MPQLPEHQKKLSELLAVLVERKLISAPQADIAVSDAEVTGMSLDEVLIARRWVGEEVLHTLAPWLKGDHSVHSVAPSGASVKPATVVSAEADKSASPIPGAHIAEDFEDNLQKYRTLMDNILGDANK